MAAALQALRERTGAPFKDLVNTALRRGIDALEGEQRAKAHSPYRTVPVDPGAPALTGVHSVHDLIAFAEGEDFR